MSKKLLNEGTVRKFMKLASIGTYADSFVNETYADYKRDDDLEEGFGQEEELADEEEAGLEPDVITDEIPEEPLGEPVEEPGGDSEALLKRVVQAVADELGVEVEVEGGEGEGELEAEPEVEPEVAPEEEEEADDDLFEAVENLLEKAGIEVVDDSKLSEDIVKKVSGRVARRLIKEFL
jgi:hypothetical protein